MQRVPMPPDTNEQVVFTKRTMREAWPAFDEDQFRADLAEQNHMLDVLEDNNRRNKRNDMMVNIVCGIIIAILLVSGL